MIQFSLFGIPVRVEPMFWLTCSFLGGIFYARTSEALLLVALFVIAAFVSVLIHEMGHALMIRKFRQPTAVTLSAFGGYATYPAGVLTRKKSFLVTAAGPAIQIAFGLGVLFLAPFISLESSHLDSFVTYLVWVSIIWAVFNCLPIYPLDGGQMLAAVLGPRRAKALHVTGMVCAGLVGLYALTSGFMLMGIFMGMFTWQNYQMLQQHR